MPAAQPIGGTVESYRACGVRVDAVNPKRAVELMLESRYGVGRAVHLCNAYTLSLALRDEAFRQVLDRGDLNLADGHPVAAIGRRRGHADLTQRVYGPDLMLATLDAGRAGQLKHYFYGGSPQVLDELVARVQHRFPGVRIAGAESPPFRPLHDDEAAEARRRIESVAPDVVWVGLGTPRQDLWVDAERDRLPATLVAIGAAFDFLAGAKPQAPQWMQNSGLEWAFRLGTEPRRLWRRYLIGNTVFLAGAAADEFRNRRRR